MARPTNPNLNIPAAFAVNGVKTDFTNEKLQSGFDDTNPDILAGDNLNKLIDDTYKGLNFTIDGVEDLYDVTDTNANAISAHVANTSNPHSVTKAQVGLGNVNNTSDANKPISTATQAALDNKASIDLSNLSVTGQAVIDNKANIALDNLSTAGSNRLHALKGYEDNGTALTDSEGLADVTTYAHSTFDSTKFTTVGSLSIIDGIASGFTSQTNYLTSSFTSTIPTTSIEMWTKFIANNNDTNGCVICSLATSENIRIQRSSQTSVGIRGYGSGGLLCDVTGLTINNDDEIIAHAIITATGATLEVWVNGVKATPHTVERTNNLNIAFAGVYIGGQYSNGNYSPASAIDLKYQRVLFDGVTVFSGNKTGIDTIKPDDYTVEGTPTISADGIASGFVSQINYITGSFTSVSATNKVELWSAITNNSADTNNSVICATNGNLRIIKTSANVIGIRGLSGGLTVNSPNLQLQDGDFVITHAIVTTTDATLQTWVNGVKQTDVTVSGDFSALLTDYNSLYIGGQYNNGNYSPASAIDINYCKVLIDGNLVYQPCLKIPYTLSADKYGSKIVDAAYRLRVQDAWEQNFKQRYYTLDEINGNFTLPQGEIYGMINQKANYYEWVYADQSSALSTATAVGDYDLTSALAALLPDDIASYECIFRYELMRGETGAGYNTSYYVYVKNDNIVFTENIDSLTASDDDTVSHSGQFTAIIDSTRYFKIAIENRALYSSYLYLVAYRKLS